MDRKVGVEEAGKMRRGIGFIKLIGLNSLEAGMLVLKDVAGHLLKGLSPQNEGGQEKRKKPLHHKNIAIFLLHFQCGQPKDYADYLIRLKIFY
jgi:hypothetical protein